MSRGEKLLYWLIQKLSKQYKRLQKESEKRKHHVPSESDSESDNALPEVRPLPDDQWHVIYSEHSRSHIDPTLMHLVEFVGNNDENDEDMVDLAIHENLLAVCSCDPTKDPDDETVALYKADPTLSEIPLLDEGEHFLGEVALTSAGMLFSAPSTEDWTRPLRSYLGVPPALLSEADELPAISAYLTEKVMGHRRQFYPKLSPATSRRFQWKEHKDLDERMPSYQFKEIPTKSTQAQTDEPKRFTFPASAAASTQRARFPNPSGDKISRQKHIPPFIGAARESLPTDTTATTTITTPNSFAWKLAPEHNYLYLDRDIPPNQWALYGLDAIDPNHPFKISRPLQRGEIRTLTMHHNLG